MEREKGRGGPKRTYGGQLYEGGERATDRKKHRLGKQGRTASGPKHTAEKKVLTRKERGLNKREKKNATPSEKKKSISKSKKSLLVEISILISERGKAIKAGPQTEKKGEKNARI